jgi:hypothetical protein
MNELDREKPLEQKPAFSSIATMEKKGAAASLSSAICHLSKCQGLTSASILDNR